MARIRSIKPEFFTDAKMATLTVEARLFYAGLWCQCDDFGVTRGEAAFLRGQICPFDSWNIPEIFRELSGLGRIIPFAVEGNLYLFLPFFERHQSIRADKRMRRNPAYSEDLCCILDDSWNVPGMFPECSRKNLPFSVRVRVRVRGSGSVKCSSNEEHSSSAEAAGDAAGDVADALEQVQSRTEKTAERGEVSCKPELDPGSEQMLPAKPERPNCPHQAIVDLYHATLPTLSHVRVWGKESQRTLQARWHEDDERQSLAWWKSYFERVASSSFLLGAVGCNFRADLRWLIQPANLEKVLNGRYDDRGPATGNARDDKNWRVLQSWIEETRAETQENKR